MRITSIYVVLTDALTIVSKLIEREVFSRALLSTTSRSILHFQKGLKHALSLF